jgi:hypothetical protein
MNSHVRKQILATNRDKLAADDYENLENKKKRIDQPVLSGNPCLIDDFSEHCVVVDSQ